MDAVKMLETMKRICKTSSGCSDCMLEEICYGCTIGARGNFGSESFVESIEKWDQEHPIKTRIQDFMEKHPNAHLTDYMRRVTPWQIGYCGSRTVCAGCKYNSETSEFCWKLPVDEKVD